MRRLLALVAFVALSWCLAPGITPASDASEVTPGLLEAREEAQRLATELDEAQIRLGELDDEIADLEAEQAEAEAALDALRVDLQELAIDQYTRGVTAPVVDTDLDRQVRASALAEIVDQHDTDTVDRFRALEAQLAETRAVLAERRDEEAAALDDLEARQAALTEELARLEQLELQRLEEERVAAEREAREAAEAEARAAARARAERLAREQAARRAGQAAAQAAPANGPAPVVDLAPEPVVAAPSGGGIVCVVPGSVFRNSWGEPRSGGRAHQGTDMMAPTGTPIVAPVAGNVVHGADGLGGNNFTMTGADGRSYYGAHLSAYGASGNVAAGTVIGYVGETGNAVGAHLHFEIHVGGAAINPYPELAAAC